MERIERRIEQFIRAGIGDWDSLALDLFAYQYERNAPYQAYCRSLGKTPDQVQDWREIPAVPVSAFKSAALTTFPIGHAAAVFESSGTTQDMPSRHYLRTLSYYELALKRSFRDEVLESDARIRLLIAAPAPAEAPRSSLSWMFEVVKNQWGAPGSDYFVQRGRLDEPRLIRALEKAQKEAAPVLLLGTTLAWLGLLEYAASTRHSFQLPADSRLFDTGGLKSKRQAVTRADFIDRVHAQLGIPESHCVNEYGMCEMSSQFYGRGKSSWLHGPPWVRTLVIPQEETDGGVGLLRHFDLANIDSVMALQTEDMGRYESGGFHLLGRAPSADAKGCSLAAAAFLP
jgi:hypothetical protein